MKKLSLYSVLAVMLAFNLACGDDDDNNTTNAAGTPGGEAGAPGGQGGGEAGTPGGQGGGEAGTPGGQGGGEAGTPGGQGGGEAGTPGGQGGGEAGTPGGQGGNNEESAYYGFAPKVSDGAATPTITPPTTTAAAAGEETSISYTGQSARQVLINAVKIYIGTLHTGTDGILGGQDAAANAEAVSGILSLLYSCQEDTNGDGSISDDEKGLCAGDDTVTTTPEAKQSTVGDISSKANLKGKMAGNDPKGQTTDWNTVGLVGWGDDASVTTPEGLLLAWFDMISTRAINIADGTFEKAPTAAQEDITKAFVTAEGHDLQQLAQKFLLGAVTFSQGADDYTDYDTTDWDGNDLTDASKKGLYTTNDAIEDGKKYTALEHAWDEGFGYFGAARDYLDYTDDEIAKKGGRDDWQGYHDTDGDGKIDLAAEYNWGHSVNAAKRDRGAQSMMVDLTKEAFEAFHKGRTIITENIDIVGDAALFDELKAQSDKAILAWEKAIAATVIHYINDTIADMEADPYDEETFYKHAKHWSELKGFALSFQFNRRSPMTGDEFAALHAAIGDKPALPGDANFEDGSYKDGLINIRAIVGGVYGFDSDDVTNW